MKVKCVTELEEGHCGKEFEIEEESGGEVLKPGTRRRLRATEGDACLAIAIGVLFWLHPFVPEPLVWPVRVYTAVISLMVVTAFGALGLLSWFWVPPRRRH